jgi:hypothetical protein
VPLEHIRTKCLLSIKHNDLFSFDYLNIAACLDEEKKIVVVFHGCFVFVSGNLPLV